MSNFIKLKDGVIVNKDHLSHIQVRGDYNKGECYILLAMRHQGHIILDNGIKCEDAIELLAKYNAKLSS